MGRFLLVTLEEDLARCGTTHNVAMLSVQHVNGVHDVVDLSAISPETLCSFLMPESERKLVGTRDGPSPHNAIRAHWQGIHQPGLPLDWAT